PAPPRPRRPLRSTAAMRSSGDIVRALPTAPGARPSRTLAATLAGIRGLEHVMDLVLVEGVVRRRRRDGRPRACDAQVPGEPATATRDRGPLALGRAAEVREQRRGGVDVGHRLAELLRDARRRGPGEVAVGLV